MIIDVDDRNAPTGSACCDAFIATKRRPYRAAAWLIQLIACLALHANAASAVGFQEVGSLTAPIVPAQLLLAPAYGKLFLRNAAMVAAIDVQTASVSLRLANKTFTDIALSPSGNFVFVADWGGDIYGYGPHPDNSFVHRLDLAENTWETVTAFIAGHIQVVGDNQFLLKSLSQGITFTNNLWSSGGAAVPINAPTSDYYAPGYYTWVNEGAFRYDVATGRIVHGNSGSSSNELQAFKILNNNFFKLETSGTYGSATAYGGSLAMATDSSAFYYGKLKVDPLDVSHNVKVFPELIHAATGDAAFGDGKYFDARTGTLLGSFGFSTTIYALSRDGQQLWAYDASQNRVRHFIAVATPPSAGACSLLNHRFTLSVTGSGAGSATMSASANVVEFDPAPGNPLMGLDIEDATIRLFNRTAGSTAAFGDPTTYTVGMGPGAPLTITGVSVAVNGVTGFPPANVAHDGKSLTFTVTGTTWHPGDSVTITVATDCPRCAFDVDGNGTVDALTDGLLMIRAMFGLTGTAATANAIGPGASRSDWAAIRPILNNLCGGNFAP